MSYQTEFPNFDQTTMPIIPEGFIDNSDSHENVCPSFINENLNMTLYIDYADKNLREENVKRFTLIILDNNENFISEICSDDYNVILQSISNS